MINLISIIVFIAYMQKPHAKSVHSSDLLIYQIFKLWGNL